VISAGESSETKPRFVVRHSGFDMRGGAAFSSWESVRVFALLSNFLTLANV